MQKDKAIKKADIAKICPEFKEQITSLISRYNGVSGLSEALGISRTTINYWANGERMADAQQLITISKKTGVSVDWLLGLRKEETSDTNLQAACEYIGLDEAAVDILHKLPQDTDETAAIRWLLNRLITTQTGNSLAYSIYLYCTMLDNVLYVSDALNPKIGLPITDQMKLSVAIPQTEKGIGLAPVPIKIIDRAMLDNISDWLVELRKQEG